MPASTHRVDHPAWLRACLTGTVVAILAAAVTGGGLGWGGGLLVAVGAALLHDLLFERLIVRADAIVRLGVWRRRRVAFADVREIDLGGSLGEDDDEDSPRTLRASPGSPTGPSFGKRPPREPFRGRGFAGRVEAVGVVSVCFGLPNVPTRGVGDCAGQRVAGRGMIGAWCWGWSRAC
ncbi:hypothetical protein GCM10009836_04960 [Pseudonocardia ailaonensis]|uniref:DUF304 domain-containing protein n=1 Tax=Pseudonocardia ailaonensis TaxID=367279 RepID=A0ABN2MNA4_9PSEU